MAPATKYGAKIVVCQPGRLAMAKSHDTTECTETTSGVARAAKNRYARRSAATGSPAPDQPSASLR